MMGSSKTTHYFYFILLNAVQSLYAVKIVACRKEESQEFQPADLIVHMSLDVSLIVN